MNDPASATELLRFLGPAVKRCERRDTHRRFIESAVKHFERCDTEQEGKFFRDLGCGELTDNKETTRNRGAGEVEEEGGPARKCLVENKCAASSRTRVKAVRRTSAGEPADSGAQHPSGWRAPGQRAALRGSSRYAVSASKWLMMQRAPAQKLVAFDHRLAISFASSRMSFHSSRLLAPRTARTFPLLRPNSRAGPRGASGARPCSAYFPPGGTRALFRGGWAGPGERRACGHSSPGNAHRRSWSRL
jgi:hypothetical protein